MSHAFAKGSIIGGVAGVIIVGAVAGFTASSTAHADPAGSPPLDDGSSGVATPSVDSPSDDVKSEDPTAVDVKSSDSSSPDEFSLSLPGEETDRGVDPSVFPTGFFHGTGKALFSTRVGDTVLTSFPEDEGTQVLTRVPSATAAKEYRFHVDIPDGFRSILRGDGSVAVVDAQGVAASRFVASSARDANGGDVVTALRAEGEDIVESVDVRSETAFPVVASLEQFVDGDE